MLRFLVDLNGGLSSGVNGAVEPREGLGEWLRGRKETVDELLLDPDVSAWPVWDTFAVRDLLFSTPGSV